MREPVRPNKVRLSGAPIANAAAQIKAEKGIGPWGMELVRTPDLSGELYTPNFCPMGALHRLALVILPDSAGITTERERAYATFFVRRGITCFIVDPAGLSPCGLADNSLLKAACTAYHYLDMRVEVDEIGVVGLGRGGLDALHAAMLDVSEMRSFTGHFSLHVCIAPPVFFQVRRPQPSGAPILVLLGEQDEVASVDDVCAYAARIRESSPGLRLKCVQFPQAHHAWEYSGEVAFMPESVGYEGCAYCLEPDGGYTDARTNEAITEGDFEKVLRGSIHYGVHQGGGGKAMLLKSCFAIMRFIEEQYDGMDRHGSANLQLTLNNDAMRRLMLRMARCQNLETLFEQVATSFGALPDTVLVRIWLDEPSRGACVKCKFADRCIDQSHCLHLVSSAGNSLMSGTHWTSTSGHFQYFPFGIGKVGIIGATGASFHVRNVSRDMDWVADPAWIHQEQVRTVLGQPLIYKQEVIGVFVIFSRGNHDRYVMERLRMVADYLAISIVHARAFEELTRLKRQLEIENSYLRSTISTTNYLPGLIGESPTMQHVKQQILQVASTATVVLILGESGTGKELVANEIHKNSRASEGPLVKVNCPTIPRELFESEFFGHVKGAFTGAHSNHIGFFEAANSGTLFLDEIGEIELSQQSKLLRVIQEGEYRRVGEEKTHKISTRIVAATNRNLMEMVMAGTFREDLFYRLNIFPIVLPPLRERIQDIPRLAQYFFQKTVVDLDKKYLRLREDHLETLQNYAWPGNIRELQNAIHRAVITAQRNNLNFDFLLQGAEPLSVLPVPAARTEGILTKGQLLELERKNILNALYKCNGKIFGQNGAAVLLDIRPTTLIARMSKLKIDKTTTYASP